MLTIQNHRLLYLTFGLTFNNSTFCPHSVFMCFVWIPEQRVIISLYSINWLVCITETVCLLRGTDWVFIGFTWIPEQTAIISLYSINWLVFITEAECVYCAVRTGYICFVWISEQTATISLYSINWLVFITETECLLRGTDWIYMFCVDLRTNSDYFPIQH